MFRIRPELRSCDHSVDRSISLRTFGTFALNGFTLIKYEAHWFPPNGLKTVHKVDAEA